MKRPFAILLSIAALTGSALARIDDSPPVIDPTVITPALGTDITTSRVTVSGTVTDEGGAETNTSRFGVRRVFWRPEGSTKWRRALLTAQDAATTTFVFSFSLKSGKARRIHIRAFDICGNESDTITRKFFRPRPDRDNDGLDNEVETNTGTFVDANDTGTNPRVRDTDGDGFSDGTEVRLGSDPTDASSTP
ncbi:MAG: hypothetical protein AAGJ79_15235 [Verrucomicrobiota bacterium]